MIGALGRFAAVRVLTGLLGLAWVLALARWMPVGEYAVYAVVFAAVMMAGTVGTLGVDRVLFREVPAAHLAHADKEVWRLCWLALVPRLCVAPAVGLLTAWLSAGSSTTAISLAFAAALGASLAISDTFGIMASALLRYERQAYIVAGMLLARLGAAAAVHSVEGELTLPVALLILLLGDFVQSALSLCFAMLPAVRPGRPAAATETYRRLPLRQLARASLANYSSYLLALPWQGPTAIVIVGAVAAPAQVAVFGLLQTILNRVRQYLPVQLLRSAFEPALVREYSATRDLQQVARQVDLLRRVNYCILMGCAAVLWPLGSTLIAAATRGKYLDAGPLAALMLLSLALRSVSEVLFISANVIGEMGLLSRVYAVATAVSIVPLWWLAQSFGAAGVVLVSVAPSWLLWAGMRAGGGVSPIGVWRWRRDLRCLLAGLPALLLAYAGREWAAQPWAACLLATVALLVYLGALRLMRVFDLGDLALLRRVASGRHA